MPGLGPKNISLLRNKHASRALNRYWLTQSIANKRRLAKNPHSTTRSFTDKIDLSQLEEVIDRVEKHFDSKDYLKTVMKIDRVIASNGQEYLNAVTQIFEFVLSFKAGNSAETQTLFGIRDEIKDWAASLKKSYPRFVYDKDCQELLSDALKFMLSNIFEQVGNNISEKICEGLDISTIPVATSKEEMKDVWGEIQINFSNFLTKTHSFVELRLELIQTTQLSLSQQLGNLILLEGEMPFEALINRLLVLNFLVPHELGHAAKSGNLLPIKIPKTFKSRMPETTLFSGEEVTHQAEEIVIDLMGITMGKWFGVFSPAKTQKARLGQIADSNFHTVKTIFNDHVERGVHSFPLLLRMAAVCNGLAKDKKIPLTEREKMQKLSGEIVDHLVSTADKGELAEIAAIYKYYKWIYNKTKTFSYGSFLAENASERTDKWDKVKQNKKSTAPILRKLLMDKNTPGHAFRNAIKVLTECKDSASVPILIDLLADKERSEFEKNEIINALGDFENPLAIPALEKVILDGGYTLPKAAFSALSKIPETISIFERIFEETTFEIYRAWAAIVIKYTKNPEENSFERKKLDYYINLYNYSYSGIVELGQEIIPLIKKTLNNPKLSFTHEFNLWIVLAKLKDKTVIPKLEERLAGKGYSQKGEVAEALIEVKELPPGSYEYKKLLAFKLVHENNWDEVVKLGTAAIPALEAYFETRPGTTADCAYALVEIKHKFGIKPTPIEIGHARNSNKWLFKSLSKIFDK